MEYKCNRDELDMSIMIDLIKVAMKLGAMLHRFNQVRRSFWEARRISCWFSILASSFSLSPEIVSSITRATRMIASLLCCFFLLLRRLRHHDHWAFFAGTEDEVLACAFEFLSRLHSDLGGNSLSERRKAKDVSNRIFEINQIACQAEAKTECMVRNYN